MSEVGRGRLGWGFSVFGACDVIAGVGHVASCFLCAGPFPVLPLETVFVLKDGGLIHMEHRSWKAIAFGYARTWCVVASVIVIAQPLTPVTEDPQLVLGIAGALIGLFAATYIRRRASPDRQRELIRLLGLRPPAAPQGTPRGRSLGRVRGRKKDAPRAPQLGRAVGKQDNVQVREIDVGWR